MNSTSARRVSTVSSQQKPADLQTCRPAYHPADFLKIYIYGYLNRIQSSRRLERETQRNAELMWLTGRLGPDLKTIANFHKDNGKEIRGVCRQFIWLCQQLGLLAEALVAIGGSKLKTVMHLVGYQHAAIDVLDPVPVEEPPHDRGRQPSDIPAPQLVRAIGHMGRHRPLVTSANSGTVRFSGGIIREVAGDLCTLLTDCGQSIGAMASPGLAAGDRISLSLRSERVSLLRNEGLENRFEAEVCEVIYHGDHLRTRVALCGRDDFIIKSPNTLGLVPTAPGQRIRIAWSVQDCRALKA